MSTKIDLKLIPEFSGNDQQSVTEWQEKVELICKIIGVTNYFLTVSLMVRLQYINS